MLNGLDRDAIVFATRLALVGVYVVSYDAHLVFQDAPARFDGTTVDDGFSALNLLPDFVGVVCLFFAYRRLNEITLTGAAQRLARLAWLSTAPLGLAAIGELTGLERQGIAGRVIYVMWMLGMVGFLCCARLLYVIARETKARPLRTLWAWAGGLVGLHLIVTAITTVAEWGLGGSAETPATFVQNYTLSRFVLTETISLWITGIGLLILIVASWWINAEPSLKPARSRS